MADQDFASVQAMSARESKNPWVATNQILADVQKSSRDTAKAEKDRLSELREIWRKEATDKADLHPKAAKDKRRWQGIGMFATGLGLAFPFVGKLVENVTPLRDLAKRFNIDTALLDRWGQQGADAINQFAPRLIEQGSQSSQHLHSEKETMADLHSNSARMLLDEQQSRLQQAREEARGLKERVLEIIRTLTSQVMGR